MPTKEIDVDSENANAPVVEMLVTVQFSPSLDTLSIIDMADLYGLFRSDFPVFSQVPRAGPMSFDPVEAIVHIEQTGDQPRLSFASEDLSRLVVFQNDRLSFGWLRVAPLHNNPSYPGFQNIFASLVDALKRLQAWIAGRGLAPIKPRAAEVSYQDAFAIHNAAGEQTLPVSDVFNFINPDLKFPKFRFNYAWSELLPDDLPGFATVSASAPALVADGTEVMLLQTWASFNPGTDWDALPDKFEAAHQAVLAIYHRVVNTAAVPKS